MNERIEALAAVDTYRLSEDESAELCAALAEDEEALAVVLSVFAEREALDDVADPFAPADGRQWSAPAPPVRRARRRAWPIAIAAALTAAAVAAVVVWVGVAEPERGVATGEGDDAPAAQGAARPGARHVLATFRADTATIDLMGVDMPASVARRDAFAMTLYWRVRTTFPENPTPAERWRIFVHFDGEGRRFQADHSIAGGGEWWLNGDVVEDRFAVMAGHGDDWAGTYDVYVGWFKGEPGSWVNADLTVVDAPSGRHEEHRLHVGRIELR